MMHLKLTTTKPTTAGRYQLSFEVDQAGLGELCRLLAGQSSTEQAMPELIRLRDQLNDQAVKARKAQLERQARG